ncbi:MAG: tetratricopeptide repeat protein [Acidobacteria bacterium]|nr:tetratricopeptide repeat protein [Acidobacteriota bacterium]
MYGVYSVAKIFLSCVLLLSVIAASVVFNVNDIVPSSDITGAASVFVFRGSSKKPQSGTARTKAYRAEAAARADNRQRIGRQANAGRNKKAQAARSRSAMLARQRARERNAKIRQSNILTARAETQLGNGELEQAISNFREALRLNSKNTEASNGLSDALTAKGIDAGDSADEGTLAIFAEAVQFDPRNEIAYMKMGEIYDELGRNAEALENYEKALSLDPSLDAIYLPIGMAYAEAGSDQKAEEFLVKAEENGSATGESRVTRALILERNGRDGEALAILDRAINSDAAYGACYVEKARLLVKLNRLDEAAAALRQGTSAASGYAPVWFETGVIAYNRGDYAAAMEAYLKVLELDTDNAQAHANLASVYRQMERYADANVQYRAAHDKGIDKDPDLYSEWGFCLGKTEEWDKAVARLSSAEALGSTAVDHNNLGWAHYNSARQEAAKGNEEAAKKAYEAAGEALKKAVEMDGNLASAFLNLGAVQNALGNTDEAINALNKALTLEPDWVISLNQLGSALRKGGDYPAAIERFKRSTTLAPDDLFGLYNLGELYHITGNKAEAKRISDRLRKLDPTLARRLDDVRSGKIVLDEAKRQMRRNVPTLRRIPF